MLLGNNNNQTHQIDVDIDTEYLPEHSNPEKDIYAFSYTVTLYNNGSEPACLLGRHWIVTDSNGKIVRAIQGKGVAGQRPELEPGDEFQYTSSAILKTPIGAMQGAYEILAANGKQYFKSINAFRLAVPTSIN